MTLLQNAIARLKNEHLSCIALKGDDVYVSSDKGLRPLLKPLRENSDFFQDAIVIDRIIGKSAAFLWTVFEELLRGLVRKRPGGCLVDRA